MGRLHRKWTALLLGIALLLSTLTVPIASAEAGGLTAGSETDTQVLTRVKKATTKTPIFCNTGCNKDNIVRQLSASDGAVCATTFKVDGKFENPVDYNRVKEFMDVVKEYRKSL